jgi:UDP-glucose 4-epimerase
MIKDSVILVTGGAGFVGSHLVEQLLAQRPRRVYVVDNFLRGSRENLAAALPDPALELIEGDIRDRTLVDDLLSRSDYCFHLAALRITRCAAEPREAFDVMLRATFDLVESAVRHRVKKIVYSSSASVYGLAPEFPTTESAAPWDNQTLYGAAKTFGEQLLRSFHADHGLDYVALRYFNVYGERMDTEGKYTEVLVRWLDCIRDGTPPLIFGDGSQTMDFVHVTDVARANVAALLAPVSDEAFNVGTARETSLLELLRLLLAANGSTLEPRTMPERTVNPVRRRLASVEKAKRLLGFEAGVRLEDGLARLSRWYFARPRSTKAGA